MNILVTGASKGIGRAIAENLKAVGQVHVTGRNEEALKSFDSAGYFVCDLANEDELIQLGEFIKENSIDVLVNNAGEYIYGGIDEVNLSDLNHIISVNLKAPIYLMNCVVPYMKSQRFGRIINIGSIEDFPSSVSTQPGLIVFTVIPNSASSNPAAFERPISPAFVEEYKLACASPITPEIEPILIILPNR